MQSFKFGICFCHSVLKSEVVDLRVCMQSADKELSEVKALRRQDKQKHDAKMMEHMQKVVPYLMSLRRKEITKVCNIYIYSLGPRGPFDVACTILRALLQRNAV